MSVNTWKALAFACVVHNIRCLLVQSKYFMGKVKRTGRVWVIVPVICLGKSNMISKSESIIAYLILKITF